MNQTQLILVIFLISVLCYLLSLRKNVVVRRWWTKPHISVNARNTFGAYNTLFKYFMESDHEEFYLLTRMSVGQFQTLNSLLRPKLEKNGFREPILPEIRLAITLVFLSHGGEYDMLALLFRVGKSTVYQIVHEVCKAICEVLKPIYLRQPREEDWLRIASEYFSKWNFPHCVGCIDGCHIAINCPKGSGSLFFNYKKFYSIVLMAACDAHKRFTWFSLGDYGSLSDSSILQGCGFVDKIISGQLNLPKPRNLPNSIFTAPFVFLGDEIFAVLYNFLKPFSRRNVLSLKEKIFNYRLARARWTIECSFGILFKRFSILQSNLTFSLNNSSMIVCAAICLHNFIITTNLQNNETNRDEVYNTSNDEINKVTQNTIISRCSQANRPQSKVTETLKGSYVRKLFSRYFMNEGSVPWQNDYVN